MKVGKTIGVKALLGAGVVVFGGAASLAPLVPQVGGYREVVRGQPIATQSAYALDAGVLHSGVLGRAPTALEVGLVAGDVKSLKAHLKAGSVSPQEVDDAFRELVLSRAPVALGGSGAGGGGAESIRKARLLIQLGARAWAEDLRETHGGFLGRNAHFSLSDESRSPMALAILGEDLELIEAVLSERPSLIGLRDEAGNTVLHRLLALSIRRAEEVDGSPGYLRQRLPDPADVADAVSDLPCLSQMLGMSNEDWQTPKRYYESLRSRALELADARQQIYRKASLSF